MFMRKVFVLLFTASMVLAIALPIDAQKRDVSSLEKRATASTTEFASVQAYSDGNGVWIKWQMLAEVSNVGFNIYRLDGVKIEVVNPFFIGGGLLRDNSEPLIGGEYSFFDPKGSIGSQYFIETLEVNGMKTRSRVVFGEYISGLDSVAGTSSEEFQRNSQKSDYIVEKNDLTLSKELQLEIEENVLPPNLSGQRFVASQPGVRIGVTKEGIYRVSRIELQNAGFNINGPAENWQLYRNGNEQAIIVDASGAFIEFFGQGIDTVESATQSYYLINGSQAGKRIGTSVRRRIGGTVVSNSYEQSYYKAERSLYFGTLRNGDQNNFFGNAITNSGTTLNFNLDAIDRTTPNVSVTVGVQGFTATPHNVELILNGVSIGFITGSNFQLMSRTFELQNSSLNEGANSLVLKGPVGGSDINFVDSLRVAYARGFLARQNSLSFYAKPQKQFDVRGFTSPSIRVFDTSLPDAPLLIGNLVQFQEAGLHTVVIPANRTRRMFATTDDALLTADSIEQNTASTLATANHNGSLIIISYKNWIAEAQAWATYRRNDGFSVEVVRIDDVFDEFSYGVRSANAVRSFLIYASTSWQTAPTHVLLLGDASFDTRGYLGHTFNNFVPTKMFDTVYEETGSDEAMADFDDDGLAELAIGRIPANNAADVTRAFQKVITFEQQPGNRFDRGALFVSDEPNGYDFAGMNQRLANELPPGTTKIMINRADINSSASVITQLNNGRFLANYSGHGSTGFWATTSFFSLDHISSLVNAPNYTIFTMLTCLNGYFHNSVFDSLSERVLNKENGGGVAVWASSGKTTPDVQEVLARRFYQKLAAGTIPRLGDLIKDAKQNVNGGRDVRLSWTLIGDPALKVN